MCRNHSHLSGSVIEREQTEEFARYTVELHQELTVEMQRGEKLVLPASSVLLLLVPKEGMQFSSAFLLTAGRSPSLSALAMSEFGISVVE